MAGIIGAIGRDAGERCHADFLTSVDLPRTGAIRSCRAPGVVCAVAAPSERLCEGRLVDREGHVVARAGHIVADNEPDWATLLDDFRDDDFSALADFSGRFALAVLDRSRDRLYLATDRLGQYPLYLAADEGVVAFSTSQASFCRWLAQPEIDPAWFHEFFLANFSASHGSFLRQVRRVGAATVLRLGLDGRELGRWHYAEPYRPRPVDADTRTEVRRAQRLFADRVPRYAGADEQLILGLTSGFDSRVVLAQIARHPGLAGFTYGRPDCEDIRMGRLLADKLDIGFLTIPFDEGFETRLGDLMAETVWLSGGLQSCTRATLLAAYRGLLEARPGTDAILSGASGDQLFRGHGNVPSIVSSYISTLFEQGRYPASLEHEAGQIFVDPAAALECMDRIRTNIETRYGDPQTSAAHMGYLTYEVPAEYFAGEACLADNFCDFRTPFCDRDIVEFAYSTPLSSLTFSRYGAGSHENRVKNFLVANLIGADPRVAAVPIQRRPVSAFANGEKVGYFVASAISWIRRTLSGQRPQPHLENWADWFAGPMRSRIESLLAPGARCESLVRRSFIDQRLADGQAFWLNKLATTEIILRLVEHRWRPDSPTGATTTADAGLPE